MGLLTTGGVAMAIGRSFFSTNATWNTIVNSIQSLQTHFNHPNLSISKDAQNTPINKVAHVGTEANKALHKLKNNHLLTILKPLTSTPVTGSFFSATHSFTDGILQTLTQIERGDLAQAVRVATGVTTNSQTYTVGGAITGITGVVVLQNNEQDIVRIRPGENSAFTFPTTLSNGQPYSVTVKETPAGQRCYLSANSQGTIQATSINTIEVACGASNQSNPFTTPSGAGLGGEGRTNETVVPRTYTIGGTLSGLSGTITLQNNGANNLSLSENGAFAFSTSLEDGASYVVTVHTQPTSPDQVCTVTSSTGTIHNSSITSISITCLTVPEIEFNAITKTYGNSPFSLTATSTSSGARTFTSGNTDVATISGATVTIIGAGTSTISLVQSAEDGYASATTSAILTVNKATPVLTFNDVTHAYDTYPYAFIFSSTNHEGGTFSFLSSNETVATIDGTSANIHASGTALITLTQTASANYIAVSTTAVLTVPGVCAVGACGDYSTSCTINTVSASCSCVAGVTGARCSIGIDACASFPCGVHGSCVRISTLGGISPPLNSHTCTCDTGYHGASCDLVGDPPDPEITFQEIIKYVGDSSFALAVTSTSGGSMSFLSSNASVATVSGGMCTIAGIGTTTITVNQASQGYLYAAGSSSTLMTVYENYCTSHVNPCLNGGTCSPNLTSFACACTTGYSGSICDLSAHNCDGSEGVTCHNGGTCMPDGSGGSCACAMCYMGATCEEFDSITCA
jgi:hypothetical protein